MSEQNTALVTGASAGLGRAVARALVDRGWQVIGTARRADRLREVAGIVALPGDVADPAHQDEIASAVRELGRLDLLMNNASRLGPSPLPKLADLDPAELARIAETNLVAPLALTQAVLPWLRVSHGVVLNVSSDAAVAAYEGWGGYGSSKAALDQLSAVALGVDPGWPKVADGREAFERRSRVTTRRPARRRRIPICCTTPRSLLGGSYPTPVSAW